MEFLCFCFLEGNNPAERPNRELKLQRVFYLAKPKETTLILRVGSCPPVLHCVFLWGFIWFPSSHSVICTPSFGSSWFLPFSLCTGLCSFFPWAPKQNPQWGQNCNVNGIIMILEWPQGHQQTRSSLSAYVPKLVKSHWAVLLLISLCWTAKGVGLRDTGRTLGGGWVVCPTPFPLPAHV